MLILEDDVLLMPHFKTRLVRLWQSTLELSNSSSSSSRVHLFTMLGFMSNGLPPREIIAAFPSPDGEQDGVTDSLVLPSQTIRFFGYAVTAAAAAGTLRATLPLRQAMDSALHHSFPTLAANNVQACCPSPGPFDSYTPRCRLQRSKRARVWKHWTARTKLAFYRTNRGSRATYRG